MPSEATLLPCPFCGGEAKRMALGPKDGLGNEGGDVIVCTGACGASSHVEFGYKENLVSLWNNRQQTEARLASASAPAGWRMVPVKPVAQMEQAGSGYIFEDGINYEARCDAAKHVWSAMLTAAPQPPLADCDCAARFYGDDRNAHQLCCAALATKPTTLSTHLQTLRLDLNDVSRSQDYIDGAQDMLDKVAGLVGRPAEDR